MNLGYKLSDFSVECPCFLLNNRVLTWEESDKRILHSTLQADLWVTKDTNKKGDMSSLWCSQAGELFGWKPCAKVEREREGDRERDTPMNEGRVLINPTTKGSQIVPGKSQYSQRHMSWWAQQAWCSPFACLFPWGHWVRESKEGLKEFKICCSGQKLNWILSCWQNLPSMHSNKVQFQIHENKYKPNTSMKCESCLPFRDISSTSVGIVTKIWNWYELKEGGLEAVPPAEPDEICTGSCLPGFLYEDPLASAFLAGLLHVSHWRRKERVLALSLHSDDCFCHAEAWLSVWVQSPSLLSPPPFWHD